MLADGCEELQQKGVDATAERSKGIREFVGGHGHQTILQFGHDFGEVSDLFSPFELKNPEFYLDDWLYYQSFYPNLNQKNLSF